MAGKSKFSDVKGVRVLMLSSWSILIAWTWLVENVPRSVADHLNVIISRVMWAALPSLGHHPLSNKLFDGLQTLGPTMRR